MTPKEQAAMQQALETLETKGEHHSRVYEAIIALREAVAERHKENCACEVCRGCDNADIKAEQAEQEPSIDFDKLHEMNMQYVECPACGSDMAMAYSPKKKAEQEPVAWVDKERMQSIAWLKAAPEHGTKLYAAPVRTKDLTDDEIVHLVNSVWFLDELMVAKVNFARAVIAADREKNK